LLGNPAKPLLAAARVLLRHQANPGSQVPAVPEGERVRHGCHQRTGQNRPDPWDAHEPPADVGRPGAGHDTSVDLQNLRVHQLELPGKHLETGSSRRRDPLIGFIGEIEMSFCSPLRPIGATMPNSPM